jgi:lipoprotein NlpD
MDLERLKSAAVGIGCLVLGGCAGWSTWEDPNNGESGWGAVAGVQQAPVPGGHYRVRRGDTLYSIAFRHGVDFRQLAQWNGIGRDYLIYPGQLLRLSPSPGGAFSSSEPTTSNPETGRKPGQSALAHEVGEGGPLAERAVGEGERPPVPQLNSATSVAAVSPASFPHTDASPVTLPMPPMGRSGWVWPTAGSVSRGFGMQGNKGFDFTGTEGQPVFAAAPGRIVYSGNALKGYGELIIIKHDEDFLSAYGYNQARHVQEGDVVTAGQPIARMGRGPENRPLLHFEVRRAGRPVDPDQYLPRR